jgi:hypothetical protein
MYPQTEVPSGLYNGLSWTSMQLVASSASNQIWFVQDMMM